MNSDNHLVWPVCTNCSMGITINFFPPRPSQWRLVRADIEAGLTSRAASRYAGVRTAVAGPATRSAKAIPTQIRGNSYRSYPFISSTWLYLVNHVRSLRINSTRLRAERLLFLRRLRYNRCDLILMSALMRPRDQVTTVSWPTLHSVTVNVRPE